MLGEVVLGSDCYWGPSVVLVEGDTDASHDCGPFLVLWGSGCLCFPWVADASTGVKSRLSPGCANPILGSGVCVCR